MERQRGRRLKKKITNKRETNHDKKKGCIKLDEFTGLNDL